MGLTKSLADEARVHGIKVCAICPAGVADELVDASEEEIIESQKIGIHHIGHRDKITRLQTITIDKNRFIFKHFLSKDRHSTRFAMGALSGSINIGVSQGNIRDAIVEMIIKKIFFPGQFGDAIGAVGLKLVGFRGWKLILLAIDGSTR